MGHLNSVVTYGLLETNALFLSEVTKAFNESMEKSRRLRATRTYIEHCDNCSENINKIIDCDMCAREMLLEKCVETKP